MQGQRYSVYTIDEHGRISVSKPFRNSELAEAYRGLYLATYPECRVARVLPWIDFLGGLRYFGAGVDWPNGVIDS
jgi:hypothetical protein